MSVSIGPTTVVQPRMRLRHKLANLEWAMLFLILAVAGFGFAMLYSAASGSFDPWASRQIVRFAAGLALLLAVAMIDLRTWIQLAYPIYGLTLALLVFVEMAGEIGMGAQRWIDVGFIQLQPSEIMKVALVLALARYFHQLEFGKVRRPQYLIVPVVLVLAPVALVLVQPDLGTAVMLMLMAGGFFFMAGVPAWMFGVVLGAAAAAVPLAWNFLHDYQRNRILFFLDPERDPLGAGYHIIQSKIAIGSGGLFGKGFLEGTQAQLNFLPERQTDFIFTMVAEELGMAGALGLLALYALLIAYGYAIAMRSRSHFGRMLAIGLTINLFLYVFINTAMVMGLIPVVGVPLPLISYGGTAMMTVLIGFGLMNSVNIHRDVPIRLGRRKEEA